MQYVRKELASISLKIQRALKGIDQVTFTIDFNYHWRPPSVPYVTTQVTLWFGGQFSKRVSGGDDVRWLAGECKRVALEKLSQIKKIAAATGKSRRIPNR